MVSCARFYIIRTPVARVKSSQIIVSTKVIILVIQALRIEGWILQSIDKFIIVVALLLLTQIIWIQIVTAELHYVVPIKRVQYIDVRGIAIPLNGAPLLLGGESNHLCRFIESWTVRDCSVGTKHMRFLKIIAYLCQVNTKP